MRYLSEERRKLQPYGSETRPKGVEHDELLFRPLQVRDYVKEWSLSPSTRIVKDLLSDVSRLARVIHWPACGEGATAFTASR